MSPENKIAFYAPGQNAREEAGAYGIDLQLAPIKQLFEAASDITHEDMEAFLEADPGGKLNQSRYAQPFVLTTSMAYFYMASEKLQPYLQTTSNILVAGHSQGEYTALVLVKSLQFEEAACLLYTRGLLLDQESVRNPQTMLVVTGQPLEEVEKICSDTSTEVANENSDEQFVIAGLVEFINNAEALIKERYPQKNTRTFKLPIKVGSHCSLEKGAALEMAKHLKSVKIKHPMFPFIVNATGDFVGTAEKIRTYLIEQMTKRVLWRQTIRRMLQSGVRDFYE